MSVTKRVLPAKKNGQATVVWVASVGSGKDRDRKQFDRKRDAEAWERENATRVSAGLHAGAKGKMLVKDYWESRYSVKLATRHERGERMTTRHLENITGRMKNYIIPTVKVDVATLMKGSRQIPFDQGIGDHRIQDVTATVAQKLMEDLRNAGVSVKSTRNTQTIAHGMFEDARRSGYVHHNPFHRLEVTGTPDDDDGERVEPPTPAFVRALLATPSDHRELLVLLATTGLRISEALALRWHHVDLDKRLILVRERLDTAHMKVGRLKSKAARRDIPMPKSTMEIFSTYRGASSFAGETDLVFCGLQGQFLNSSNIRARFMPKLYAAVSARLTPSDRFGDCGFHPLRHYAISAWIAAGLNAKTVQTYAGHASINITMDTYGHLFTEKTKWDVIDSMGSDLGI